MTKAREDSSGSSPVFPNLVVEGLAAVLTSVLAIESLPLRLQGGAHLSAANKRRVLFPHSVPALGRAIGQIHFCLGDSLRNR